MPLAGLGALPGLRVLRPELAKIADGTDPMVMRLLACNAEHWLSGHLNAYLRDDDEYRAITRQTIIRGLAGTITYTPAAITVTLEQPASRRVARALELLLDEINADPPAPATPARSTTRSPRTAVNCDHPITAGGLRRYGSPVKSGT